MLPVGNRCWLTVREVKPCWTLLPKGFTGSRVVRVGDCDPGCALMYSSVSYKCDSVLLIKLTQKWLYTRSDSW